MRCAFPIILLLLPAIAFGAATTATTRPTRYPDGRPSAALRMNATDEGIVLHHAPEKYDAIGARDVFVWRADGKFYMHYDAAGPTGWLAALATSDDGRHWTKHGPVLDLGGKEDDDSATASYGVTFFDEPRGRWHLFYVASRHATPPPERIPAVPYLTMKAIGESPAGPWSKQPRVIPFRVKPGTYYSDTASPGQIIPHGGEYLMFFSAAHYATPTVLKRTLGIARTRDLDGSWKVDKKPIVPPEEQIENASIYFEPSNRTWFLFTNHVGLNSDAGEYTDAVWAYWSDDPTKWDATKKAVVLDGSKCAWSKRVIGLPSVLAADGKLLIYYDGVAGDGTSHVGRDVGVATLALPLSPPR